MGYSLYEGTNEEEEQEKLPGEDVNTPFSPPDGKIDRIPKDQPSGDTNADIDEWYQDGRSAAFGTEEPGDKGIKGFDKGPDEPKNGPIKIIKPKQ